MFILLSLWAYTLPFFLRRLHCFGFNQEYTPSEVICAHLVKPTGHEHWLAPDRTQSSDMTVITNWSFKWHASLNPSLSSGSPVAGSCFCGFQEVNLVGLDLRELIPLEITLQAVCASSSEWLVDFSLVTITSKNQSSLTEKISLETVFILLLPFTCKWSILQYFSKLYLLYTTICSYLPLPSQHPKLTLTQPIRIRALKCTAVL